MGLQSFTSLPHIWYWQRTEEQVIGGPEIRWMPRQCQKGSMWGLVPGEENGMEWCHPIGSQGQLIGKNKVKNIPEQREGR